MLEYSDRYSKNRLVNPHKHMKGAALGDYEQ